LAGKYLAAYFTQKTFNFSKDQRMLIFGLSNSQAAATLAAVLIGYNIILGQTDSGEPIRLLDENILNGTIVMILITCTISSFATQKSALSIAKEDLKNSPQEESLESENTLVGLANETTVESLIQLAITTIDKKRNKEIFGLHIITSDKESPEAINKASILVKNAEKFAASADFKLYPLIRYDSDIASGIINTVKEKNIRHFYIGLHEKSSLMDSFFGNLTTELLARSDSTIYIHKSLQPINTIKKFVLIIPANAELELGFNDWYSRIMQIAITSGNKFEIYANLQAIEYLQKQKKPIANVNFNEFDNLDDFLVISKEITADTMLIVNLSRKDAISYQASMDKVCSYLNKYFKYTSFMLVYANNFNKAAIEKIF